MHLLRVVLKLLYRIPLWKLHSFLLMVYNVQHPGPLSPAELELPHAVRELELKLLEAVADQSYKEADLS